MDINQISSLAGLLSLGLTLLIGIGGGFFFLKGGLGERTTNAQNDAITAMQSELSSLRRRAEDEERNRVKLEHVIDTMISALKDQGIVITVTGELIKIEVDDQKKTVTTIKINQ